MLKKITLLGLATIASCTVAATSYAYGTLKLTIQNKTNVSYSVGGMGGCYHKVAWPRVISKNSSGVVTFTTRPGKGIVCLFTLNGINKDGQAVGPEAVDLT